MDEQDRIADFLESNELDAPPAYRLLDLVSEMGELAKDANTSTEYGTEPESLDIAVDEIGDTLFALLALCVELDVDAGKALDIALAKYERRIETAGEPGSGE